MPQVNRTCLIIIPIVLCFTMVAPNIIYATKICSGKYPCIQDLTSHIQTEMSKNINIDPLLTKKISPKIYNNEDLYRLIDSENYEQALIVILEDYSTQSETIQGTLTNFDDKVNNATHKVTAAKQLYDVASTARACYQDEDCNDVFIKHTPDMEDIANSLDVAALQCSGGVPDRLATVLKNVVGVNALDTFEDKRTTVCEAIKKIYNLKYKLQQLHAIRENGFSLLLKHDKKIIKKKGRKRTAEYSINLVYYPDIQENYNSDAISEGTFSPEFSLNNPDSYFKWSKNDKVYLADILNSENASGNQKDCDDKEPVWFRLGSRLEFRLKMSDVQESECTFVACLRIKWRGDHNKKLAQITIPAPFGYLDELTQMKDAAVQSAMHSLQNQIAGMLGINDKLDDIATKLDDIATRLDDIPITSEDSTETP